MLPDTQSDTLYWTATGVPRGNQQSCYLSARDSMDTVISVHLGLQVVIAGYIGNIYSMYDSQLISYRLSIHQ